MEDGWLELGNNPAEHSIKPFARGRRKLLLVNTPLGAQTSAVLCRRIKTAKDKEIGLAPFRYLTWVLKVAPMLDQTVDGWVEPLLMANASVPPSHQTRGVPGGFICMVSSKYAYPLFYCWRISAIVQNFHMFKRPIILYNGIPQPTGDRTDQPIT